MTTHLFNAFLTQRPTDPIKIIKFILRLVLPWARNTFCPQNYLNGTTAWLQRGNDNLMISALFERLTSCHHWWYYCYFSFESFCLSFSYHILMISVIKCLGKKGFSISSDQNRVLLHYIIQARALRGVCDKKLFA